MRRILDCIKAWQNRKRQKISRSQSFKRRTLSADLFLLGPTRTGRLGELQKRHREPTYGRYIHVERSCDEPTGCGVGNSLILNVMQMHACAKSCGAFPCTRMSFFFVQWEVQYLRCHGRWWRKRRNGRDAQLHDLKIETEECSDHRSASPGKLVPEPSVHFSDFFLGRPQRCVIRSATALRCDPMQLYPKERTDWGSSHVTSSPSR